MGISSPRPFPGGHPIQVDIPDPTDCRHIRSCRLGIQRFPFPPFRVYLLRCLACETTLTTGSLRETRKAAGEGDGKAGAPSPGSG